MENKLFKFYSLDETTNRSLVVDMLNDLKSDGKIVYHLDNDDILEIQDIDLDDFEIEKIILLFNNNDVFPYLEREDTDYDYDDNEDEYDDDNYDY